MKLKEKTNVERPRVIFNKKNNKFVMWFHLDFPSRNFNGVPGVAVSDNPYGPFKIVSSRSAIVHTSILNRDGTLGAHSNSLSIDKSNESFEKSLKNRSVFRDFNLVELNKSAYIVYVTDGNKSMNVVKLDDSYTTFTNIQARLLVGMRLEAPAIFTYKNTIYIIASGLKGFSPTYSLSFKSNNILGPWYNIGNPYKSSDVKFNNISFDSQSSSTFYDSNLKSFVLMGDRWNKKNLKDSGYIWSKLDFNGDGINIKWSRKWCGDEGY